MPQQSRATGAPPPEPWEYDDALTKDFQRALGLRYALMPYIYGQAKDSSARGVPMVRPVFFECPKDPGSWNVDDEYMVGSDLLVAPMFASGEQRDVYLPPGKWIDYQSGAVYEGEKWREIKLGEIPVVLLVRNHSVLPHIKVAQSTSQMDWDNVELRVFSTDASPVSGLFTRPDSGVQTLSLVPHGSAWVLRDDPQ